MKLLACWPIPEAFACLVIIAIASRFVQDLPTAMILSAVVGISVDSIGNSVRTRYGSAIRRWLNNSEPPDGPP